MAVKIHDSDTIVERFLFKKFISKNAPTIVIIAGLHGNEVSGIYAINSIIDNINNNNLSLKTNLYVLSGNLNAISKGIRYETIDLNRLWNDEQIKKIKSKKSNLNKDELEQKELYFSIKEIVNRHTGEFIFVDLHTTSSHTIPFLTYGDSLKNRRFSKKFPVPSVFGIEEYITGTLLTYVTEFGHIGVGFEAGEHHDKDIIAINKAFLWHVLVEVGCVKKENVKDYQQYVNLLVKQSDLGNTFFEIVNKHSIQKKDKFLMIKGYRNFQRINKNQKLAISNNKELVASTKGRIFLPLYQDKGEDGYFIIKKTPNFWLRLSRFIRNNKWYHILSFIPGVSNVKEKKYTLKISSDNNSLLLKTLLNLFGYRKKTHKTPYFFYTRSDRDIKPFV